MKLLSYERPSRPSKTWRGVGSPGVLHVFVGVFAGSVDAWIAGGELDPLTVALCKLVFEACAQGTDVRATPEEGVCAQH